jgi:hypothetical protein
MTNLIFLGTLLGYFLIFFVLNGFLVKGLFFVARVPTLFAVVNQFKRPFLLYTVFTFPFLLTFVARNTRLFFGTLFLFAPIIDLFIHVVTLALRLGLFVRLRLFVFLLMTLRRFLFISGGTFAPCRKSLRSFASTRIRSRGGGTTI